MLDLSKAYETLGLSENATEEELENRYLLLMKKKQPGSEEISKAYKFIKEHQLQEEAKQKAPKNETLGKVGHIWEYYRFHIIGSILAVILIVYTTVSVVDNKREARLAEMADVKFTFFTNFQVQVQDAKPLEERLLTEFKDWKQIGIYSQYSPIEAKDQYDIAMQQKAFISIGYDKTDVYLLDKSNFEKFGPQGAFKKLDGLGVPFPKEKLQLLKTDSDTTTVPYGIDVTNHPLMKELRLPPGEKVAAIRHDAKNLDNAIQVLQYLSK